MVVGLEQLGQLVLVPIVVVQLQDELVAVVVGRKLELVHGQLVLGQLRLVQQRQVELEQHG